MLALAILFLVAQVPPQKLQILAVPLFVAGVLLLLATAVPGLGITKKGATRWLNVGVPVIQPSEILKIGHAADAGLVVPEARRSAAHAPTSRLAGLILLVPVGLVVKQPDLGTLLIPSGLYVIFFAGLSWKLILPVLLLASAVAAIIVASHDLPPTACMAGAARTSSTASARCST